MHPNFWKRFMNKIIVKGNYKPSGHCCGKVHDVDGISSTVMENHGAVIAICEMVDVVDDVVINPLKGKTKYGWHFEQNVYDPNGITRAVKAGGGSGNIPKVIETEHDGDILER